jgi:hypothetical protein
VSITIWLKMAQKTVRSLRCSGRSC